MSIFNALNLLGGLCLFLFGMNLMGEALERISDHCSNIAGGIIDFENNDMNIHENLRAIKAESPEFKEKTAKYKKNMLFLRKKAEIPPFFLVIMG